MKQLSKLFISKEKIFIYTLIFILLNISIYIVYQQSIYSFQDYQNLYPQAGLEFYYNLHCIGTYVFLFMINMLLLPNILSYDFLSYQQNHFSYMIESRINKNTYYKNMFILNMLYSFLTFIIIELMILFIVHIFYIPIQFNLVDYPTHYYVKTQILSSNEITSLILFIIITSLGYSLISCFLFSLQVFVSNKYIYRCFGVILGIALVVIPALIQGYLPIDNIAFVLQINNLVALGMENVRKNPFGLSHILLFMICFSIYMLFTYFTYRYLLQRRKQYD